VVGLSVGHAENGLTDQDIVLGVTRVVPGNNVLDEGSDPQEEWAIFVSSKQH